MEDIRGREFDWYAIDNEGNIAMFASGGSGQAPKVVIENYAEYDDISEEIEQPNWGSINVWQDYAKLGFYVFETNINGGPFIKRAEPFVEMDKELKSRILRIKSLPKFSVHFGSIKEFTNYEEHM